MFDEGPVSKVPAPQVSEVQGSVVSVMLCELGQLLATVRAQQREALRCGKAGNATALWTSTG